MLIRSAEPKDFAEIADLYVSNHKETYKGLLPDSYFDMLTPEYARKKWMEYQSVPGRKLWVAYENDGFLGFSAGAADNNLPNTWLLDSLHVTKAARGKGVGTALIHENRTYAANNGFSRMSICIVRGNESARALYEKLGAQHYSFFDDTFGNTISHSEKLIWDQLAAFR